MTKISKKQTYLIVLAIIASLILGFGFVLLKNHKEIIIRQDNQTSVEQQSQDSNQNIESIPVDDIKLGDNITALPENETDSDTARVTPFITSATVDSGTLTGRGFVPSILEDEGKCTFRLVNNSNKTVAQKTTNGFKDVAQTGCQPATLSIAGLDEGTYKLFLDYSSIKYSGTSQSFEVKL